MSTVLITGCSSGFGLETARFFADKGWDVVATMRAPREDALPASDRIRVLPLDVTDAASIAAVIEAAGPIDALVNNAGIGYFNAVEGTPMDTVRDIFETNTLGTIAMTQAVIPQFRERRAGVIVNVTSTVTLKNLPFLSVYTASKAAVNAFTDVIALELEPFGVRVRVVLPGRAPDTRFGDNARTRMAAGFPEPYIEPIQKAFARLQEDTGPITTAMAVAEGIWQAVTDPSSPAHIPAGDDAVIWAAAAA
jgi:NAD(P)-dependent dehydrogenase (short-subunit alcohol dehydrogenase family)